ncbi:MAG: VOC family protein [Acidimicrobiales bacterium]
MESHGELLSAVTLFTADMAASVAFYEVLGLETMYGGTDFSFTTLKIADEQFLNLQRDQSWLKPDRVWGRFIVWVDDVDAIYESFLKAGYAPLMKPSDASWGERYFHIVDPAGHEVSIARRSS